LNGMHVLLCRSSNVDTAPPARALLIGELLGRMIDLHRCEGSPNE
jgi:hypothetical protein